MGILNLTPDSFYDGGRYFDTENAIRRAAQMLEEGAQIIDVGAYSSRPGATEVSLEEEIRRVAEIIPQIAENFPNAFISVDTFRSQVARHSLESGAHILNDISAGSFDPEMIDVAAEYRAPLILMHIQGKPQTMQAAPNYRDVSLEVIDLLGERIIAAKEKGVRDIVIDPGFGFGKTLDHNYELFRNLSKFQLFGLPVLVGISRKSMIYKLVDANPDTVLELSSALHLKALEAGVKILRVHDVKAAVNIVKLYQKLNPSCCS